MKFCSADDVIQGAKFQFNIGMLIKPVDGIEDKIKCKNLRINAQQYERQRVKQELDRFFYRMEPSRIDPVQLFRGMMDRGEISIGNCSYVKRRETNSGRSLRSESS